MRKLLFFPFLLHFYVNSYNFILLKVITSDLMLLISALQFAVSFSVLADLIFLFFFFVILMLSSPPSTRQARNRLTVGGRTARRSLPEATSWCDTTTCTKGTSPSFSCPSEPSQFLFSIFMQVTPRGRRTIL